jgi:hypothetical protein
VRACPLNIQIIIGYSIDEQPVRFDVTLSVVRPIPDELVIFISRIKRFFIDKQFNNRLQFAQIFVLFFDPFKISLETGCIVNR